MTLRLLSRLVAAVILTAAASLAVPLAPASASTCATASGVTVVVDFHDLGGGSQAVCDAGGAGKTAAAQFADAGFALTRVASQRGFVCRVENKPESDPCQRTPPADAYWGVWWSDGKSGSWTYASQGVDSLTVPEGGYVALSWNGSTARSAPGTSPTPHPAASPSPSSQPSSPHASPSGHNTPPASGHATSAPTSSPTTAAGSPSASGSPSAGASPVGHRKKDRSATSGPSALASDSASSSPDVSPGTDGPAPAASDPADPGDSGLPGWVAPAAIGLLFVGAAGTAVVRRRRGTTSP